MATFEGFSTSTFAFLEALAFNNNRDWFEAHRQDYEAMLLEPALALISDMAETIEAISPRYHAVAKKSGGSLMRIYRDTRFSKDKTPYKTNIGIQFRHEREADVHTPGFYIHLSVGECFLGVGSWRPEAADLQKIRERIANHPAEYTDAVSQATASSGLRVMGESLKKPPRGFDPSHPLIDELRRIDFLLSADLAPELFLGPPLLSELSTKFRASAPYMRFLCSALGAEF